MDSTDPEKEPSPALETVYAELRRLAKGYLAREGQGHTLQPTALVHEAYLKLAQQEKSWNDPSHFAALCAGAMRRILVDHARAKKTDKRGSGSRPRTLSEVEESEPEAFEPYELLALDDALEQLAALNERQARLVELRFFGGLSLEDAARHLQVARSTAIADWRFARAWLNVKLGEPGPPPSL